MQKESGVSTPVVGDADNMKESTLNVEQLESETSSLGFSEKDSKRLVRKVDYVLIPFLALLYL